MSNSRDYTVNFFKPQTDHSRANMKMIIIMILIWAVANFGFQWLLYFLEKPVPEKTYTQYQVVWPKVVKNEATKEEKQEFTKLVLMVLGKNIILKPDHRVALQEALNWSLNNLLPADKKGLLKDVEKNRAEIAKLAKDAIGLKDEGFDKLMLELLPVSIIAGTSDTFSDNVKNNLPGVFKLYCIHNQSVLTDTKFLGFPFHYFYTSQFLLIMFVVLCLLYCIITDRIHEKYGFVEEHE